MSHDLIDRADLAVTRFSRCGATAYQLTTVEGPTHQYVTLTSKQATDVAMALIADVFKFGADSVAIGLFAAIVGRGR